MDSALLAGRVGVAGLSLGAFSTATDLVRVIHHALDAWEQFRNAEKDVEYFKTQLLLQKGILDSWTSYWYGFRTIGHASVERLRLLQTHDDTIQSTLTSVQSELQRLDPFQVLKSGHQNLASGSKVEWIVGQEKPTREALGRVETLLKGLYMLLPPKSAYAEAQIIFASYQAGLTHAQGNQQHPLPLVQQVAQLRQLNDDLEVELKQRVAAWQDQALAVANLTVGRPAGLQAEEGTAGTRSHGELHGKKVLVEWKAYAVLQGPQGIKLRGQRDNLVKMLKATPKPEELLALPCAGYFDDVANRRYGFVLESPARAGETLVSLNTLLRDTLPESLPSLQDRYQIVYRLALSLSIFFVIGWLHKGLRSHNILFVQDGQQLRWARQYLCGSTFSRPDKPDEVSEKLEHSERFNLYRHPLTQNTPRSGYRKAFDIYSFGVILFEVAAWMPAFKRWDHDPVKFRKDITKPSSLARVAHWMGSDYRDVMLKCLDGTFEQEDVEVPRRFFMEVVEVLRHHVIR